MKLIQIIICLLLSPFGNCKGSGGYVATRSYSQVGSGAYGTRRSGTFIYLGGYRRYGGTYNDRSYNQYATAAGYQLYGSCDPNEIEVQAPQTKNWIIVQVGSTNTTFDPAVFEIDAFREFSWRSACYPPTQVIVIQRCALPDTQKITSSEEDDPTICHRFGSETSGDSYSQHRAASRKLLSQSDTHVIEFYIGSRNDDTAGFLSDKVKESLNDPNSQLRLTHQLTHLIAINIDFGMTDERKDLNNKAVMLLPITGGFVCLIVFGVTIFALIASRGT